MSFGTGGSWKCDPPRLCVCGLASDGDVGVMGFVAFTFAAVTLIVGLLMMARAFDD